MRKIIDMKDFVPNFYNIMAAAKKATSATRLPATTLLPSLVPLPVSSPWEKVLLPDPESDDDEESEEPDELEGDCRAVPVA